MIYRSNLNGLGMIVCYVLVQAAADLARSLTRSTWPGRENALSWICRDWAETVTLHTPRNVSRPPRPPSHDFQGIKFRRLGARQDLLDCPAERLLLVNTRDHRSELTSKAEEGPSRSRIFRSNRTIEIRDNRQPGTQALFESQGFRQECTILDQDGPVLMVSGIGGSPRRLSWRIVSAAAGAGG